MSPRMAPPDNMIFNEDMSGSGILPGASLLSRDAEYAVLTRCAEQSADGVPWLVVVEGEAGIGKTTLVRRFGEELDGTSLWWAGCDRTEQDWPFSLVDQWLRHADPRLVKRSAVLSSPLSPHLSPVTVGAELVSLIGAAQEHAPVVLVADDIPWADEMSAKALGFLLRRLWADRVLVLVTARVGELDGPPETAEWRRLLVGAVHTRTIHLHGLSEEETAQWVRQVTSDSEPQDTGPSVARRLWERTGGNPLYLSALLADTKTLWHEATGNELGVPPTLVSAVAGSLSHLDGQSRRLAEALAVLDREVPLSLAGQVADVETPSAALEPLLDAGLVTWSPFVPTAPVRIRHALQRDAVYQAITPARRRALHTKAAALVDTDTAWGHRVAACDHPDPALATALERHAEQLLDSGRILRSATLLQWAADLSPNRELREQRLLTAAAQLNNFAAFDVHRAFALRQAVEQCSPHPLRTALLARYAYREADYRTAIAHGRQALAQAEASDTADPRTLARARTWLGTALMPRGEFTTAIGLLTSVAADSSCDRDLLDEARFNRANAVLFAHGPRAALALDTVAALPGNPTDGDPADALMLTFRGYSQGAAGRLQSACRDLDAVLAMTDASPLARMFARYNLALHRYLLGQWDQAAAAAEQALVEAEVRGWYSPYALSHYVLAAVAAGQGRWQAANEHLDAGRTAVMPGMQGVLPGLTTAVLATARDDADAAYTALEPFAPPDGAWPESVNVYRQEFWPHWCWALTSTKRLDRAQAAVSKIQELVSETPSLRLAAATSAGLLAEADNDFATAAALYEEALQAPAGADDPPMDRAGLQYALGRLHRRNKDRRAATTLLRQAHTGYAEISATAYTQRVAADLDAVGVATSQRGAKYTAELTDREHAVARLAAQGHTNQEIAAELFVSPKTVEYHLSHVFSKLQLTSRRQLRGRFTPGP